MCTKVIIRRTDSGYADALMGADHQALLGLIQRFYAAWDEHGESATTEELVERAVEALAIKALFDHPERAARRVAYRLQPGQPERIEAAYEALTQHLAQLPRQSTPGKRRIRFA